MALVCVDLCTGSGTALSLAAEVPRATVHAVETDERALAWAARNVEHNGLAVILHAGDAASALPEFDGTADLVASNPPYVATGCASKRDRQDQPERRVVGQHGGRQNANR